jgi:5-methylcytosine-specific restriction endonuclease McrA
VSSLVDIKGKIFGQWFVISQKPSRNGSTYWLCRCSCGVEKEITYSSLSDGRSKSCGHDLSPRQRQGRTRKGAARWRVYKDNYMLPAKKRGYVFELTEEQFCQIATSPCFYCGDLPSQVSKAKSGEEFIYNGVDRIVNEAGYTLQNSVPCCSPCNIAKNDHAVKDFIERCRRIAHRHG